MNIPSKNVRKCVHQTSEPSCIVRDEYLSTLFPDQKTFNQFLRRQYGNGALKQIIPNYRVDTSNYRFYQWFFHREPNKNSVNGKEIITIDTRLKYHNYHLSNLSSNGLKFRSNHEKGIYEKLLTCDYLTIEYESPRFKVWETKYVDFKISNRVNQKIYFWEHFGMTHSPKYLDLMIEKIRLYRTNGFKTVEDGGNLIFTFYSDWHNFQKDVDRYIGLIKQ